MNVFLRLRKSKVFQEKNIKQVNEIISCIFFNDPGYFNLKSSRPINKNSCLDFHTSELFQLNSVFTYTRAKG